MREVSFKVKTKSPEEYEKRLNEMKELLTQWVGLKEDRNFEIKENVEELNFKITATKDEDRL